MASARKDREQRFVEEYLTDLNGARAYTAAGYHAKTPKVAAVCAAKLLARASIANAIQARQKAIAERTNITVEGIVRRLAAIGFGDIRKLFDDKGALRSIHQLPEDVAAMVASIESDDLFQGSGDAKVKIGVTQKVKLWDQPAALISLGKHLGMFKDRPDSTAVHGEIRVTVVEFVKQVPKVVEAQEPKAIDVAGVVPPPSQPSKTDDVQIGQRKSIILTPDGMPPGASPP